MKTKISTLLSLVALLLVFTTGCKTNKTDSKTTMNDLNIPDGFTFETTHEVPVTIQMPSTIKFNASYRSRFNIYNADPAEGGKLLLSGSFDDNNMFSGKIKVPVALSEIYVTTIVGDLTVQINNPSLKEDGVIINFGDDYGLNPPDTTEPGAKSIPAGDPFTMHAPSLTSSGTNMVGNGDFETNDYGTIYYWSTPHAVDNRWYFTQYQGSMEWYDDGGDHVVRTPWTEPGNYYYGGVSQMINANAGDVITFSADIKSVGSNNRLYSWLYLIPRTASGSILAYYNLTYYHPSSNWTTKTLVATMPSGTASCQVLVWTNDYTADAAVYVNNAVVLGPVTDSDGDGVDDDLDDYPNDPTMAFNVYYPNENDWGTLAYEDLWPGEGDYDFNDLVLDYHFKSVLNSSNQLVKYYMDYSTRAVGASLINGFGLMMGGDPTNIASVTGTQLTENYLSLTSNGTENNQTNSVVFLFDNAFNTIGSSGSQFINTKPDVAYVDPDTNQLVVTYNNPTSADVTGTAPYNPFIVVDRDRGKEVHLAGEEPTDLADNSLFGTWIDDSNPATGKWYQTANNLPWAIDLPVSFDYPVEQVEILNAYNHFREWAESGGSVYTDWYEDNTGYRVSENIYTPPTSK